MRGCYMSCRTGRLLLTDGAQSQTAQQVGVQSSHSSQHSLDAVFPIVDIHADCIDITAEYKCPRGILYIGLAAADIRHPLPLSLREPSI